MVFNVYLKKACVENLIPSAQGWEVNPNDRWIVHEGSSSVNSLMLLSLKLVYHCESGFLIKRQVQPLSSFSLFPSRYHTVREPSPDTGTFILGFPTSRTVSQLISIHYKLPSPRYFVTAAQNRVKPLGRSKFSMAYSHRENFYIQYKWMKYVHFHDENIKRNHRLKIHTYGKSILNHLVHGGALA